MTKVYIKFGEPLPDEDHIYVYEGLLEDNIVKIILPTASYSMCQTLAKDIEQQGFIVEGIHIGQANNGLLALREFKIRYKLHYNTYMERYETEKNNIEVPIEKPKASDIPEEPDSVPKWMKTAINIGYYLEGKHYKINSNQNNLRTFKKQ